MLDIKGIGSEGAIVNLIISAFLIWHLYIRPKLMRKQGRDRRTNPSLAPGNAEECKQHSKDLAKAETNIKNIKDQMKESDKKNREDHQLIFSKIDKLRNARR